MKNYFRFYLWENGAKSTDYSDYIVAPIFFEEKLNEELDTAEVILDNMPIATKNGFAPKTKFRLERYHNEDEAPQTWDMVVEHDDVEEYVGCPEICCHRISLIEASAIAQGMHVDNIALTYELQDVTLQYKTYASSTDTLKITDTQFGYATPIRVTQAMALGTVYFMNSYRYVWSNTDSLTSLIENLNGAETHTISFTIPTLTCQGVLEEGGEFEDLFECNVETIITRRLVDDDGNVLEEEEIVDVITGQSSPVDDDGELSTIKNSTYAIGIGTYVGTKPSYTSAHAPRINSFSSETTGLVTSVDDLDQFDDHIDYYNGATITQFRYGGNSKEVEFDTVSLSDSALEDGQRYEYNIFCKCKGVSSRVPIYYVADCTVEETTTSAGYSNYTGDDYGEFTYLADSDICIDVTIYCVDLLNKTETQDILKKAQKYSCLEMFRKAMLTTDTQIIDNEEVGLETIEYPIIMDAELEEKLSSLKMSETMFESKNLWEVLIQIGYYLHAIPYLTFATDGTDRFVLNFKRLGVKEETADDSRKITIYNSQNLNEYFTQYDSYVTNLFSPQNLVDEWLVLTTEDDTTLISNDTGILKTTYGISEIVAFEITYGSRGTKDAIDYIFEESIYNILTADYKIIPGKGTGLYYTLGDNKIQGLNYVPPSTTNDRPMALKSIVGRLFSGVTVSDIKFNDLKFHIQYRTQDSMRLTQIRPDIERYMKNSAYEKFPHHEQFYGQQDKIVDSERLSRNLFGQLIRVGNNVYQCQEYAEPGSEKEAGDLVKIGNNSYYITETEEEWYHDATFQKITYSKDFNQLSQIVTIPSEPRFYEVSERSKVTREIRMFDFLKISTISNTENKEPRFLSSTDWKTFVSNLIFNKEECTLPNYAWVSFIADKQRKHYADGVVVTLSQMFPSSDVIRADDNTVVPVESSSHSDVIVPVLRFPLKDGIAFEWDMEDNFKAGDATDVDVEGIDSTENAIDGAYYGLVSVRYCDLLGRADLFRFKLFNKDNWTLAETQDLPKACIDEPDDEDCQAYVRSGYTIGLDKDCREALSFNYQISLLYRDEDNTGDFVTFSNMFGTKSSELYCCLLDEEVSMFDENTDVISANVLADSAPSDDEDSQTPTLSYSITEDDTNEQIVISFNTTLDSAIIAKVKSLVFYEIDDEGNKVSYLAKNFTNTLTALPNLYIYPVFAE